MAIDQLLPPEDDKDLDKASRTMSWILDTVCGIVDSEGLVFVGCKVSATAPSVAFKVQVAKEDLGKVIGKNGRNARTLRSLLGCRAKKDGIAYSLDIAERTTTSVEKEEEHG
jgi:predicted RNA-binding protein YlqC (UPF0109 family)